MTKLYVLYDAQCQFCCRCRAWLEKEPAYLQLEFIPARSEEARRRFDGIESYEATNELLVIGEDGAVYQGPNAFIMCLYALTDFREWSVRLAQPSLLPFARQMFDFISNNRVAVSKWLKRSKDDEIARALASFPPVHCGSETMSCLLNAKRGAVQAT